jgi:hypothetical protein
VAWLATTATTIIVEPSNNKNERMNKFSLVSNSNSNSNNNFIIQQNKCLTGNFYFAAQWWDQSFVQFPPPPPTIPMITSSNPSGGSELTFRYDLQLTARGDSMRALLVEFACLPCYPGNTLCSQRLEPPGRAGIGAIQIPKFIFCIFFILVFKIALP